jgi:hypothetical protein
LRAGRTLLQSNKLPIGDERYFEDASFEEDEEDEEELATMKSEDEFGQ